VWIDSYHSIKVVYRFVLCKKLTFNVGPCKPRCLLLVWLCHGREKFVLGNRLIFNFISQSRRTTKIDKLTCNEEFYNVHCSSSIVLVLLYGGWEFYGRCMGQIKINVFSVGQHFSKCIYVSSYFFVIFNTARRQPLSH